ncbi:energy-coupling factor transporter ATPase [Johnsonella ignava]|uniref:energy-coupling factor transporter ATPase n=1 Tax=Johnsonella ignava TaxID=43995 RepID=UPI001A98241E
MIMRAEKLNYIYSRDTAFEHYAVKDVSFDIKNEEFIGIIGHTGSGKSTLIQHMNGLIKATSGKIFFHDTDIYSEGYDMKKLRQKVGLVFQYPEHQLFEIDVLTDVCFGPKNQGLDDEQAKERARYALSIVDIPENFYKKSPFELSGGQKRRVAIAGVLAMKPEILVLDEPTAGLDPRGRDEILDKVSQLRESEHMSVVLVSHSMEDVAKYVDRLMVMSDGRKVFDDTPKVIFRHYKELEKIGLSAPQITYIIKRLREEGLDLDEGITTIEEAREAILGLLKNNKGLDDI